MMHQADTNLYPIRLLRKDIGVALVTLVALGLGWLLLRQADSRTFFYQDPSSPFRIAYPAGWVEAESLQDVLLKVEDPQTDSAFKTTLTVESRDLDPASPPTLQTLIDRRVAQYGTLTAFRFLRADETTVAGLRGTRLDFAYVAQPIDGPRRAALPIVVQAREYLVIAKDRTYYIRLAAPQHRFADEAARLEQIVRTAQVQ